MNSDLLHKVATEGKKLLSAHTDAHEAFRIRDRMGMHSILVRQPGFFTVSMSEVDESSGAKRRRLFGLRTSAMMVGKMLTSKGL